MYPGEPRTVKIRGRMRYPYSGAGVGGISRALLGEGKGLQPGEDVGELGVGDDGDVEARHDAPGTPHLGDHGVDEEGRLREGGADAALALLTVTDGAAVGEEDLAACIRVAGREDAGRGGGLGGGIGGARDGALGVWGGVWGGGVRVAVATAGGGEKGQGQDEERERPESRGDAERTPVSENEHATTDR